MSSEGSSYPISYIMQVEGDAEVESKLNGVADSMETADEKTEAATQKTVNYTSVLKESALGISTADSSVTSLYFQYDNLEKAQTRVDKAERTLTSAQSSLISAQQAVNKLNQEGITSGADYEKALLNLKSAQDGVAIATDRVSQAQGDVTQSQIGFALNVVPSVLSSINAITTVTDALRASKILNVGATAAESAANVGATGTMGALTTATVVQTEATEGATLATRLLEVAMGPVGCIIIGVGAATAALATNFLGFRDAVNAAGKAIGDAMPFLRPLLDGLSSLADAFGLSGDKSKKGQEDISNSLTSIQGSTSAASTNMINDLSNANTSIEQDLGDISDNFNKSASQVESAAERMRNAITSLGGNVALPGQSPAVQEQALQQNIPSDKQIMDLNQAIQNYTDFKNQVFTPGVTQVGGTQADTLSALLDRKQEAERQLALDQASRAQYRSLVASDQQQQQVKVDVTLTADADLKAKITSNGSLAASIMTQQ